MKKIALIIILFAILAGCSSPPKRDYWLEMQQEIEKEAAERWALYGDWRIEENRNPLNDSRTISAQNTALGPNARFSGMLAVSCIQETNSISILLAWPEYLSEPSRINYRFDKDAAVYASNWVSGAVEETHSQSTSLTNVQDWKAFLRNLLTKSKLYAQAESTKNHLMEARYNLDKTKNALNEVFDACHFPDGYVYTL